MLPAPSPPRRATPGAPAQAWAASPPRHGMAREPGPRGVRCSAPVLAPMAAGRTPAPSAAGVAPGSAGCSSGSRPHRRAQARWPVRRPAPVSEQRETRCRESPRWRRPWQPGPARSAPMAAGHLPRRRAESGQARLPPPGTCPAWPVPATSRARPASQRPPKRQGLPRNQGPPNQGLPRSRILQEDRSLPKGRALPRPPVLPAG